MASRRIVGLHKRPGSSYHWLTVMVPVALRNTFHEGRSKYRMSLGTTDTSEARVLALSKHAEFAERFRRELAQLTPAPQAAIHPDLADTLAERAAVRILKTDDAIRYNPEILRPVLDTWAPKPIRYFGSTPESEPEASPKDGMTPTQLARLTRMHEMLASGLSQELTRGQLKSAEMDCAAEAAKLGLAFDWSKNRSAVVKMAQATLAAWLQVVGRDHGIHSKTPPMPEPSGDLVPPSQPVPPSPRKGMKAPTLWDVRDEWAKGQKRDAQGKMDRALKMVEAAGLPMQLDLLTKQHGRDFRAHVNEAKANATPKTRSDIFANVTSLLRYAANERGHIEASPWEGLSIPKGKPANKRIPWAEEDLQALLAAPLFQRYALPADPRAGGAAAYWVPLLALHGGFREAEIVQLRVRDVVTRDGVLLIDVNEVEDEHGTKSVKSAAGVRRTPVHSNLLRLGFSDFVADMRERSPDGLLFPDFRVTASRTAAEYMSDSFRRLCQQLGIYRRWRDFHSFRTTLNTALRGLHPALDESLVVGIVGHEGTGVNIRNYTVHAPKALQRALELVSFPAAQALPHVYRRTQG